MNNPTRIANPEPAAGLLFHRCRKALFSVVLFSLLLPGLVPSFAGDITAAPRADGLTPADKLKKPYFLTGDWGGVRPALEDRGITFDLFEIYDVYGNVSGGDHRALEYFGRTRLTMDMDLEKLLGWKGAEFYVTAVTQQGENFAKTKINVYTNPSGIEGKQTTRLAEVWLQQKLFDDKLAIKVGKIDGVGEFGAQELASTFMNDELNYVTNQTFTAGMPFDPAGKPGAVVTIKPFEGPLLSGGYAKVGIFAGNDNNAYFLDDTGASFAIRDPAILAAEIGWRTPHLSNGLPGVYKAGIHYNFGDTARFIGTAADSNYFIYGNASQTLCYLDDAKTRHFDGGFTLSGAPGDRNKNYFEATAILRVIGPWASRPKDEIGVGFIISNFSNEFSLQSQVAGGPDLGGSEKTLELSYKAQVNRWFVLQPNVQLIFDPIGDSHRDTVILLGMRTVVVF
jgi:porin